jgi:hypothetical protein
MATMEYAELVVRKTDETGAGKSAMSAIIERDILHIGRLMRASVFLGLADSTTCDYLDARLSGIFHLPHITNRRRHHIGELERELDEIRTRVAKTGRRQPPATCLST